MKNLLLVLVLLASQSAHANPYDWKITKVIDGDTVQVEAKFLPIELKQVLSIRVLGVDTPEKAPRAKCAVEASKAKAASAFTREQVAKATVKQINIKGWDKYGGRVLGDVVLDGKSLKDLLIQNGHARAYDGGAKQSWCN